MKYKIVRELGKFRAYIYKNRLCDWIPVEEDNDLCASYTYLYNSQEKAKEACIAHHKIRKYPNKENIVEEFEL